MTLTQEQIARVRSLQTPEEKITPDRVVEDARLKSSPLHSLFEWDKSKAASIYWLAQAREIIGAVEVITVNETTTVRRPFYVRDPDAKGEQGYVAVSRLRANPDAARESLIFTLRVASGHLSRALELAEPLGMSAEIDALIENVTGLQRKLRAAA